MINFYILHSEWVGIFKLCNRSSQIKVRNDLSKKLKEKHPFTDIKLKFREIGVLEIKIFLAVASLNCRPPLTRRPSNCHFTTCLFRFHAMVSVYKDIVFKRF